MSSERNLLGTNGQKVRLVNPRYPFFLAVILVAGGVLGAAANLWQLVAISGAAVLTACTLIIFVRRIKNFCALALICFLAVAWYGWAGYNVNLKARCILPAAFADQLWLMMSAPLLIWIIALWKA